MRGHKNAPFPILGWLQECKATLFLDLCKRVSGGYGSW